MRKLIKMFLAGWSGGNKKRIVISLSTIGIVSAMAVGVTVSYFQDKEASTGNKFQAGKLNLKIDNTCHYNGMICTANKWVEESGGSAAEPELIGTACECTWSAKDLTNEMFFNLLDVKPGDIGEDTVSIHVDNNDAWVCAELTNLKNFDNGCDSPENKIDTTCGTGLTDPGEGLGELQDNLFFSIWKDNGAGANACNNVKDADEAYLVENQKATSDSWPIADSTTGGGPIKGDVTSCIGIAWNVPISTSNIIQSDSFSGDVIFNAVQARNMKNFRCSDLYAEVCDGADNDYDNLIDNGPLWTNKGRVCEVGLGACKRTGTYICDANAPAGETVCSAIAGQSSAEACDGIDNDCNGVVDDGLQNEWYQDLDGDTYGNIEKYNRGSCTAPAGFVANSMDCNDNSASVYPGATEICGDGVDNDCNGVADDGCQTTTYLLTVSNFGGGIILATGVNCGSDCSENYSEGTAVTLTASPYDGAQFLGWTGACTGTSSCTITMDAAKNVSASFAFPLSIARAGSGLGTVTSSPSGINCGTTCSHYFPYIQIITLTATPNSGSTFAGWSGACSGTMLNCQISMNMAHTATATFNAN